MQSVLQSTQYRRNRGIITLFLVRVEHYSDHTYLDAALVFASTKNKMNRQQMKRKTSEPTQTNEVGRNGS